MSKSKMFQFAVIWNPTAEQEKEGQKAKILVEPRTVLGKDEKAITMLAVRAIPSEYDEQLDQVDVIVRPF
jgi:hypothetical protein